jgi:hypothetical protein
MFQKIFLGALTLGVLTMAPSAYAGKMELTTYYPAPYGEYKQLKAAGADASNNNIALQAGGSAGTGLVVTNANNVGIGTATPGATLDVFGDLKVSKQIRSVPEGGLVFQTSGTAIDWDNGNVIVTTASCQAMTFSNMKEGGAYTLIVKGATAGTCTFSQTGISPWKFAPANGPSTASTTTVYTFIRAQNVAYVSWITGF